MNIASLFTTFENVLPERECRREGGTIPSYVIGTLLRNGPGVFEYGETEYKHLFDGDAYVQRYAFKDGKMFYSARVLETDTYLKNKEANRIVVGTFGTRLVPDPCKTLFQRFAWYFQRDPISDNTNISFQELGDSIYALTETTLMVPLSTESLDIGTTMATSPSLFSIHTSTAHCHSDKEGNVYNIGSRFGRPTQYIIVKMSPKQEKVPPGDATFNAEMVASVESSPEGPAYYHSFGMSENYFVLIESPLRFSLLYLTFGRLFGKTYKDAMDWVDGMNTVIIVVDRRTSKKHPVKMFSDPFFTFHHANTFEREGFIVLDYSKYRKVEKLDTLLLENVRKPEFYKEKDEDFTPYLHRMIIPLNIDESAKTGDDLLKNIDWKGDCKAILCEDGSIHLSDERLSHISTEFPRYNYDEYNTKYYRYVYGSSILKGVEESKKGIVKIDCEDKQTLLWSVDNVNQIPSEPIFVADPEGKNEDDGVLTVPVMTTDGSNPYVVVLNAKDMSEISRFIVPVDRIPFGFHSHYTEMHTTVPKKTIRTD